MSTTTQTIEVTVEPKASGGTPRTDAAVLVLRLVSGSLLAGHGAQKLFGSFGGYGLEGTGGYMASLGLRPGKAWAALAGASELGGGALTALGLLSPVGPLASMGAMVMATTKGHAGKPIWASAGGAELPVLNLAALSAVTLIGPGRWSLDRILGTRQTRWLAIPGLLGIAATVWFTSKMNAAEADGVTEDAAAGDGATDADAAGQAAAATGDPIPVMAQETAEVAVS
jgi:putative oxidoreductase